MRSDAEHCNEELKSSGIMCKFKRQQRWVIHGGRQEWGGKSTHQQSISQKKGTLIFLCFKPTAAAWRHLVLCGQEAGQAGRAGAHLVAAVLVQHHQEDGHHHNDADHDEGVEHGVEEALAHRGRVLRERRVDAGGGGQGSTPCPPLYPGPEGASDGWGRSPGTPAAFQPISWPRPQPDDRAQGRIEEGPGWPH